MIQSAAYSGFSRSTYRWLYVILGNLLMMGLGTVYAWGVFRIPVEQTFGIGATQSGLPYMVSLAFYALFMLLSGKHLSRFSPRAVMTVGALLVGTGWMASAYAPNIYVLTLTYGVISGAGVGIAYGVPMAVAAKWFPDKKGLAVGLVLVGFGLSPLVTAPVARNLIEIYGGMATFRILGAAFATLLPLLALPLTYPPDNWNPAGDQGQGQGSWGSRGRSLGKNLGQSKKSFCNNPASEKDNQIQSREKAQSYLSQKPLPESVTSVEMVQSKSFRALYATFLIGAMIGLMLIGMTGKIAVEWVGLSQGRAALMMSFFAVFNGLGRPVFGWLTDRLSFGKAALISYSTILAAALLMVVTSGSSAWAFALAFSIFWFNLGGWLAIAPTSTLSMFGVAHYSQNYGIVFTAYGIGAVAGVLGSGLLVDWFGGYLAIFYLVLALALMGVLGVSLTLRKA